MDLRFGGLGHGPGQGFWGRSLGFRVLGSGALGFWCWRLLGCRVSG